IIFSGLISGFTFGVDEELDAVLIPDRAVFFGSGENVVGDIDGNVEVLFVPQKTHFSGQIVRSGPCGWSFGFAEGERLAVFSDRLDRGGGPVGFIELSIDINRLL